MRKALPWAIGGLGVVLVVLTLVSWLYPTSTKKTIVSETSTTNVVGRGAPATTRASKTTTTNAPGENRPETFPALVLGTGTLLILVAAFWSRILEIGLPGGGSIKLKDAEASTVGLDDVTTQLRMAAAGSAEDFANSMTSLSASIIGKANELYERETRVVPVDLGRGDKWLLPNLYFLALVFDRWTHVDVLVFTETEPDGTDRVFVACGTPRDLKRGLDIARPEFAAAAAGLTDGPVTATGQFFQSLKQHETAAGGAASPTWVNATTLLNIASDVLIRESVAVEDPDNITRDDLLRILAFGHQFVPITHARRLVSIVDPGRLARTLARDALT